METPCPCCTSKAFSCCCEPLLTGNAYAKTPVQLMRSRYSAYALGGYGDYLVATWLLDSSLLTQSAGINAADLSVRATDWQELKVLDKSQRGDQGFVEFEAIFIDQHGQQQVHHEKSIFKRINGRWLYADGDVY